MKMSTEELDNALWLLAKDGAVTMSGQRTAMRIYYAIPIRDRRRHQIVRDENWQGWRVEVKPKFQ